MSRDIKEIHDKIAHEKDIGQRLRIVAGLLVGSPYFSNPLIGSADRAEKMVADLQGFDCVTFVETTLALARSRTKKEFLEELRKIRYKNGEVDWFSRLHYFYDWMQNSHRRKVLKISSPGLGAKRISTTLGIIEKLPPRKVSFDVVPKNKIRLARERIQDGSVVAFATVKSKLDFFHVGLLFWGETKDGQCELLLFHAAKSAGKVLVEPLDLFLKRVRIRGIAFATPKNRGN